MTLNPQEDLVAAVRGYASDVVGCSSDRIKAVRRLEDGNRHAVYKVSYRDAVGDTKDLVIRISYGGDTADSAQAEREATVLKKAGGVAAPLLYDFRCTSAWFNAPAMCTQFVPGHKRELSSVGAAEIARLGSLVAWVHERPVKDFDAGSQTNRNLIAYAQRRMESIISTLSWVRDPLPGAIQDRLRVDASALERSLERLPRTESFRSDQTLALLHGDIASGNILWGPDPVLIDWEYMRLGDPADEIAYLFDQNGLAEHQREAFWRGYREGVSHQSRLTHLMERVSWWEPVTLLGSALWWVERWVRRTEADAVGKVDAEVPRQQAYYLDHVIRRADRLQTLLV